MKTFTLQCLCIYSTVHNGTGAYSSSSFSARSSLHLILFSLIYQNKFVMYQKHTRNCHLLTNKWTGHALHTPPLKSMTNGTWVLWHFALFVCVFIYYSRPKYFLCLIIRLQFIGSLFSIHFANVSTCDDWHISLHLYWRNCNAIAFCIEVECSSYGWGSSKPSNWEWNVAPFYSRHILSFAFCNKNTSSPCHDISEWKCINSDFVLLTL